MATRHNQWVSQKPHLLPSSCSDYRTHGKRRRAGGVPETDPTEVAV